VDSGLLAKLSGGWIIYHVVLVFSSRRNGDFPGCTNKLPTIYRTVTDSFVVLCALELCPWVPMHVNLIIWQLNSIGYILSILSDYACHA
jgi:hypothetical protein